ncbi:ABC transporter ATP-binding protein/permease [bacterium]|nr:ABC transporter ATP-binding protein/permease [bacterium]
MTEPEASSQELDSPHRGLNVVDFQKVNLRWSVRKAISLLPRSKRKWLYLSAGVQVSLSVLDLIGIALIGLVASVAVSGIGLTSIPAWAQNFIDAIGLGGMTVTQLSVILAIAAVFILVFKTVASAFLTRWITRFLASQQAEVSTRLARGFLALPLANVQRWTTSEAIYALGAGVSAATTSLLSSATTIASETFLFTIVGVSLLLYDPVLTISAGLFFAAVLLILQRSLSRWTARNAETMKSASIDTLTAVNEALLTYRETTVLHRRELYVEKYAGLVGNYARAGASNSFILEVPKYVLEASLYVGILLLGFVQFMTKDWGSAAATVAIFLAASSRITPGILRLQGATISIRNAGVAAQPTFFMADYLAEEKTLQSSDPSARRVTAQDIHDHLTSGYPDFDAKVVVSHVSFTYSDAPEPALHNVSVTVPAGASAAFVGSTGAGKSTLTDIVLGVLEADQGFVTIGGLAPKDAIATWPGAIAYVPQAVALVGGSVRDNVALGMPRDLVDDDLVWEALRRAHLADFLVDNREGLDTSVGERGFRLSGGQRQRLGIARALYTRPKLLVLDEATSALDSETEQAIVQTLAELEGEVTTITVAHRLATVRNCDELLFLQHGHVVGRGTFAEVREQAEEFDRQASLLGL